MYREWKEIELCWFGDVQRVEGNRIPKRVLYMNSETTRLRGRSRNTWQDEVREDGRIFGGEEWQGKVYNREEWKKLLRMARTPQDHMSTVIAFNATVTTAHTLSLEHKLWLLYYTEQGSSHYTLVGWYLGYGATTPCAPRP
jgi:hypothetical protein